MTTVTGDDTSVSVFFYAEQDVGGTNPGEPKTGLNNTHIDSARYIRTRATPVTITVGSLAGPGAAYSSGGFVEVDASVAPGLYRFDVPNAAIADGANEVAIQLNVAAAQNALIKPLRINILKVDLRRDTLENQVWDEILTGATHNINNSAGKRLRQLGSTVVHSGTAQAGTATTITLDTGASATSGIYPGTMVVLLDGTGVGQSRLIVQYDGPSRVAVVQRNWTVNPASDTEFAIIANAPPIRVEDGQAQAGGTSSITLAASASAVSGTYDGMKIPLMGGTGAGQARLIISYDGPSRVATVDEPWTTTPDSTTIYAVFPTGRADIRAINGSDIAAARLALSASNMIPGTVDNTAFAPTVTQFEVDDITEATDDHFNGRLVIWTSGALLAQVTDVTGYTLVGGRGKFTVVAMTEAPANNDTFLLV